MYTTHGFKWKQIPAGTTMPPNSIKRSILYYYIVFANNGFSSFPISVLNY